MQIIIRKKLTIFAKVSRKMETEETKLLMSKSTAKKPNIVINCLSTFFLLIGLMICLLISIIFPKFGSNEGPLKPEITSSWICVIIIFFISGLIIKLNELKKATLYCSVNIYIQIYVFIFFSIQCYLVKFIINNITNDFNDELLDGLIILGCIPTTIASNIVYTQSSNGNDIITIVNALISNIMGIFLTPLLVYLYLGNLGNLDFIGVLFNLSIRVVLPFFIGQIIGNCIISSEQRLILNKYKFYLKKITEIAILYIVMCALSDTFYYGFDASLIDVIIMATILILIHIFNILFCWFISIRIGFNIYDRIGVLFCCVQKTVAFGLPLIDTLYGDNDNIGLYITPLLLYVPIELIIDSLLVNIFKNKINKMEMLIKDLEDITHNSSQKISNSNFNDNLRD